MQVPTVNEDSALDQSLPPLRVARELIMPTPAQCVARMVVEDVLPTAACLPQEGSMKALLFSDGTNTPTTRYKVAQFWSLKSRVFRTNGGMRVFF